MLVKACFSKDNAPNSMGMRINRQLFNVRLRSLLDQKSERDGPARQTLGPALRHGLSLPRVRGAGGVVTKTDSVICAHGSLVLVDSRAGQFYFCVSMFSRMYYRRQENPTAPTPNTCSLMGTAGWIFSLGRLLNLTEPGI